MPLPLSWREVLDGPAFLVNMAECKDRLQIATKNVMDAGFTSLVRWEAVDARRSDDLAAAWARHGNPAFDPSDAEFVQYPGKQGCFLSHVDIWKHIVENRIPFATIFEDDVFFHSAWHFLAHKYFEGTPPTYDLLYFGSQIELMHRSHILRTPVFCTHAYLITLEGAQRCLDALLKHPVGVSTIDCMLINYMNDCIYRKKQCPFNWFAWNGTLAPDPAASADPSWAKRNSGLVFQDASMGSFVRPW